MEEPLDPERLDAPWTRSPAACVARSAIVCGVMGPLMDVYTHRRVLGREHLAGLDAPVVFVANHASHMDTPAILRALPPRWRHRTAVAAAADYFYADRRLSLAVSLSFGTVPLARKGGGALNGSIPLINRLIADRWSLLIYAEGTRSRDGVVGRLRPGAAVLAGAHGLPIVPIHVAGTHATMPTGRSWMTRAPRGSLEARRPIEIRFGAPIRPSPGENRKAVMERVRLFLEQSGARTTPPGQDPDVEGSPGAAAPGA
ncbi:MAG: 1-acyl-sn-glycerol-3-phosphate acyltransferase [Actinomycetota bacterium]|nr:1-acyl-sn-glycerol-3-phosphate acyltransferase [Actinomycetota bacterium]